MRVLVVEDQIELAETVATGLRQQGMAVDVAFDGNEALSRAAVNVYDVIVLDRGLPGLPGDDVCRSLVANGCESRVLMLTAAGTIEDRVDGLGLGSDDYLPKPFAFAELVARIHALGRRAGPSLPPTLVHGDLRLDPAKRIATRGGVRLPLTPKEFSALEVLLRAQGGIVSTDDLLDRIWDGQSDPLPSAVKMTISRLRSKLGEPPVILTVSHVGYSIG
jgi:DNA-binding response OmpR family regulator